MSGLRVRWDLAAAGAFVLACAAGVQDRTLPVVRDEPRTKTEWNLARAADDAEIARFGPSFLDVHPEHEADFFRLSQWLEELSAAFSGTAVLSPAEVDRLVDELYVDRGHPALTYAAQDHVLHLIARQVGSVSVERLSQPERRRLASELLKFDALGGARCVPSMQALLGEALASVGGGDAQATARARELLDDALQWARTVESEGQMRAASDSARRVLGDTWALAEYEFQHPLKSDQPLPPRFEKLARALRELLDDDGRQRSAFARKLRETSEGVLDPFPERSLTDDLLCRLLITYGCLLQRRSPDLPDELTDHLQLVLVRVVRNDFLRSPSHWRLWAQAVIAVRGDRLARPLRELIERQYERREELASPDGRRAIEAVQFLTMRP